MPNDKRAPPSSQKGRLKHAQSKSDPDLTTAAEEVIEPSQNIATRHKRPRISGSPTDEHDPSKAFLISFKNDLLAMLEDWKSEQKQTLSQLVTDVAQLKVQCSNIQQSSAELDRSVISLNKDYEDVLAKVSLLEKAQYENNDCIIKLETKVQELQQKCRPSSIEIRNVPAMSNEKIDDLLRVAMRLGQVAEMEISPSNIRDIYRLPGKPGQARSIFVEFSTVYCKNNFLAAVRNYNKGRCVEEKLNTLNLGIVGERKPIYVEEHLTPTFRRLFYLARDFAKRNAYTFCWISNGKILLRKNSDTKESHMVKTEQCLLDLELRK